MKKRKLFLQIKQFLKFVSFLEYFFLTIQVIFNSSIIYLRVL